MSDHKRGDPDVVHDSPDPSKCVCNKSAAYHAKNVVKHASQRRRLRLIQGGAKR